MDRYNIRKKGSSLYIGWIKKTCQNFNCGISEAYYYWPKFLPVLIYHVVIIHGKLYDCSFTNISTASEIKHDVINCNAHSPDAMAPSKDSE
jgi:hypothetical protein